MKTFSSGLTARQIDVLMNTNINIFQDVLSGSFVDEFGEALTLPQFIAKVNTNLDAVDTLLGITTTAIPTTGKGSVIRNAINARIASQQASSAYVSAFATFIPHPGFFTPYFRNPLDVKYPNDARSSFASVIKVDSTYHMFYDAGIFIGHSTSPDGLNWTPTTLALEKSAAAWDNGSVGVPLVWKEGATWYMIFMGRDSTPTVYKAGLATSANGITWTKEATNPILEGTAEAWDAGNVEIWGIMKVGATYYGYYDSERQPQGREIGLATSINLIDWTKDENNPIFTTGRFCSSPFKYGGYYYLLVSHYTDGSDYGEIEMYRDLSPTFYEADRELVKVIKSCAATGWDSVDQDTPHVLTDDINRDSFVFENGQIWIYYSGYETAWKEGLMISEGDNTWT